MLDVEPTLPVGQAELSNIRHATIEFHANELVDVGQLAFGSQLVCPGLRCLLRLATSDLRTLRRQLDSGWN